MIILISGNSCVGKTLMSQTLLEKYKMPYFSIDHLKMGIFRSDENCGFTPCDSNEHISGKLWPIIKGMIMTAIENKQNMVIEGCYVLPKHLDDLHEAYRELVVPVFFGFSTDYVKANFETGIVGKRRIIEKRDYDEERPMAQFVKEHKEFIHQCEEQGVKHFVINKEYTTEVGHIYDYIETCYQNMGEFIDPDED